MNDATSVLDVPEPRGLMGGKRPAAEFQATPESPRAERSEALEGRGQEIALEAMKEDKRIWMRRSSGAMEKAFVINIFEKEAECCWVQPDGSVMYKRRLFSDIAKDQNEATTQRLLERSEAEDAYFFSKNLRKSRSEKQERGIGRDRIEPLQYFDPEIADFREISDDFSMSSGGPGGIFLEEEFRSTSPFVTIRARRTEYEDREKPAVSLSPVQLMRDQLAYFKNVKRTHPLGKEKGLEEYLQETRGRELERVIAQTREEWRYKDVIRTQAGYAARVDLEDVTVGVSYYSGQHAYLLYAKRKSSPSLGDDEQERDYSGEFEVYVNRDLKLSRAEAKNAFDFAVAQLQAGKSVAECRKSVEEYIESLNAET